MMPSIQQLIFYFFSSLAILASSMVVISKNSVRAVLFLVFTFFCMAVQWLLLEAEFLAIALVVVYVGAVMVLFLFVVMMLDIEAPKIKKATFVRHWVVGLLISCLMLVLILFTIHHYFTLLPPQPFPTDYSNVKAIGTLLYSDYLLPFEVAGVILLVGMIAAISLTFRGPRAKKQIGAQQVAVKKGDRLRIVNMPSEGENA